MYIENLKDLLVSNDANPIDIGYIQFKQNETSTNIEKKNVFRKNHDSEYFTNIMTRNHGLIGCV